MLAGERPLGILCSLLSACFLLTTPKPSALPMYLVLPSSRISKARTQALRDSQTPTMPQKHVQETIVEQIADASVPRVRQQVVETPTISPLERVSQCMAWPIPDVLFPRVVEEIAKLIKTTPSNGS